MISPDGTILIEREVYDALSAETKFKAVVLQTVGKLRITEKSVGRK